MKKRVVCICMAAALLLALAAGCVPRRPAEENGLRLWFAVPGERQSREVTAALGSAPYTGSSSASDLLAALLAGPPQDSGLVSLIPPGTGVVDLTIEDRTARVELSGDYARLSGIDRTIADYCVTLTLSQLPGVDRVELSAGDEGTRVLQADDVFFES